jgi:hypothetical protein
MALQLTNLARGWNPLWLLLAVPIAAVCGGLGVYLFTPGHTEERKQVAKNDKEPGNTYMGLIPSGKVNEPQVQAPAKVQQWEYKAVIPPSGSGQTNQQIADAITDQFNKLAQDGWEYHSPLSHSAPGNYVLFKRPRRATPMQRTKE